MADDFQVGSGGHWWGSSRNPSPSVTAAVGGEGLGWTSEDRSSDVAPSISGSSNLLQDPADSSTVSMLTPHHNSDLQIMGLGLNSHHHTIDWNPNLLRDGEKADSSSFRSMFQEQWRQPKLYSAAAGCSSENSSGNVFKQSNRGFSLDNQPDEFNSEASESYNSDPMIGYGSPSAILLQGLLATSDQDNRTMNNNSSNYAFPTNYVGGGMNSSDSTMNTPWLKFPNHNQYNMMNSPPTSSTHDDPSQPLIPTNNINVAPFWNNNNNSPAVTNDPAGRAGFFQSIPPPFPPPSMTFEEKPEINNTISMEGGSVDLGGRTISSLRSVQGIKKNINNLNINNVNTNRIMEPAEASNKRARSEATPSPLPPFKVRKEKMGDRITALQQLVSPFGKTDTASVLSEAIEYIKFLHEQVGVLSSPYMKNGGAGSMQKQQQQQQHNYRMEKSKEAAADGGGGGGAGKQDLRSRGLCLVPVSSTFPMTHEPTVDYWNPTFGGTFR